MARLDRRTNPRRLSAVKICLVAVLLLMAAPVTAKPRTYTVRSGDTLSTISKRQGISVADLRRWNHLYKDRIRPGDTLHLSPPSRSYRVRKGETLSSISARVGVEVKEILQLNPSLVPTRLKPGDVIDLPGEGDEPPSKRSVRDKRSKRRSGKRTEPEANDRAKGKRTGKGKDKKATQQVCAGKLMRVPAHPAYLRAHRDAAWATAQTLDALKRGFDHVRNRHRSLPLVKVLDASRRDLGPTSHRSHREGRDVDITYFQRRCPRSGCPTMDVPPSELDARRQWTLLSYWLRQGDVEMIFISHSLQKRLYDYAKLIGTPQSKLKRWFQYPRSTSTKAGVIRHWSGHDNHIHVRFRSAGPGSCGAKIAVAQP